MIYTGKPAYHDEEQSDTRSTKRAELIEEAKDKARELRADAIIGVKLETNANLLVLCGTAVQTPDYVGKQDQVGGSFTHLG